MFGGEGFPSYKNFKRNIEGAKLMAQEVATSLLLPIGASAIGLGLVTLAALECCGRMPKRYCGNNCTMRCTLDSTEFQDLQEGHLLALVENQTTEAGGNSRLSPDAARTLKEKVKKQRKDYGLGQ
ncbi:MAG: hypothetical protein WCJ19_06075 [bacterium]